jgi:hypothetical protein
MKKERKEDLYMATALMLILVVAILVGLLASPGKFIGDPDSALPWLRPFGDWPTQVQ